MGVIICSSGHGGNYSWSNVFVQRKFIGKVTISNIYIYVTRYNKYQRNIIVLYIGVGWDRDTNINPSSQFQ